MLPEDLNRARLSVIIHDINECLNQKDIERVIQQKVSQSTYKLRLGKPYVDANGEQRRKAYINFQDKKQVDEFMKNRPFKVHGKELKVSRYNPKDIPLSGQITSALVVKSCESQQDGSFRTKLTEHSLNKYLGKFGSIISCKPLNDGEYILQFKDYDSIDRIILKDVSHKIDGMNVIIEKTPEIVKDVPTASNLQKSCIHVTNMPMDVTSEELSSIFLVCVGYILIQPGYELNDHLSSDSRVESEAWIKCAKIKSDLQELASEKSGANLRGYKIQCKVIDEPFNKSELCNEYEKGQCSRKPDQCWYKHILCDEPDTCVNQECWYGHTSRRQTISKSRVLLDPRRNPYRLRISNLSPLTTKEELLENLDIHSRLITNLKFQEESTSKKSIVVYLVNQSSENFLRKKILQWQNKPLPTNTWKKIQFQLEKNMDFFNWENRNRSSSSASILTKSDPWRREVKDCVQVDGTHSQNFNIAKLAPEWRKTNENSLNDTNVVCSIINKGNKDMKAVIKVYRNQSNGQTAQSCACREQIILENLTDFRNIPKFLTSNTILPEDPWIIMEKIEGVTLKEYIRNNPPNLHEALVITLDLLTIVKQIHTRNIVHRNITPDNIMIRNLFDLSYMDRLVLTGCSSSVFSDSDTTQNLHNVFNEDFDDRIDHPNKLFYRVPQMQIQQNRTDATDEEERKKSCRSPTIDSSHICAILFWMITKKYPKESKNIENAAPHELKGNIIGIKNEIEKATGIWTETTKRNLLTQYMKLIFDRGFADFHRQWSIEELEYQIRFALQLTEINSNNAEESSLIQSLSNIPSTLSLSNAFECNPFLRMISVIFCIREQIIARCSNVPWLINEINDWHGNNRETKCYNIITFKEEAQISQKIYWCAEINKQNDFSITIHAKINDNTGVELPLGVWNQDNQKKFQEDSIRNFELQMKLQLTRKSLPVAVVLVIAVTNVSFIEYRASSTLNEVPFVNDILKENVGTIGQIVCTVIFSSLSCACLSIGVIRRYQCPVETKIPLWLTVNGGLEVEINSFIIIVLIVKLLFCRKTNHEEIVDGCVRLLNLCLFLFMLVWLILGSIWMFKVRPNVQYDMILLLAITVKSKCLILFLA
ncbi:hypothetical protein I4U23_015356 [Adineta vaga]|nr:hypothetical protein I4U23_015356 [Adineta vaga]